MMNLGRKLVAIIASVLIVSENVVGQQPPQCTRGGFFRFPEDCTRFYRCVDLWGRGNYRAYTFSCPAGTVFDEAVSVCNWPYLAAPCDQSSSAGSGTSPVVYPPVPQPPAPQPPAPQPPAPIQTTTDKPDTILVQPTFDFQCTAAGFFSHESDCQRFWLCKQDSTDLESQLFKCPDGYLFHDMIRRCLKEPEVDCDKTPNLGRIAQEPQPIQLREEDLDGFFGSFSFFRSIPFAGKR